MISRIWNVYVFINYSGQRVTGSFFTKTSVINTIMFELSFVMIWIPYGVITLFGIRSLLFGGGIGLAYVLLLWWLVENKLKEKIDFQQLESRYTYLKKWKRYICFFLLLFFYFASFILMLLLIKLIV
jgi:hypothetical protein